MTLSDADLTWNRACDPNASAKPWLRVGDRALADLLLWDSIACNGGALHSIEVNGEARTLSAVAGFRFFGLEVAAQRIEAVRARIYEVGGDPSDVDSLPDDVAEELESWMDDPSIEDAFRARLLDHPEEFAPLRDEDRRMDWMKP